LINSPAISIDIENDDVLANSWPILVACGAVLLLCIVVVVVVLCNMRSRGTQHNNNNNNNNNATTIDDVIEYDTHLSNRYGSVDDIYDDDPTTTKQNYGSLPGSERIEANQYIRASQPLDL
jgi:hypothetical protein